MGCESGPAAKDRASRRRKAPLRCSGNNFARSWTGYATVLAKATELESGGRMIDAILSNNVLPEISRTYLNRVLEGQALTAVSLSAEEGELTLRFEPL